jgi:hypothetical protein
MSYLKEEDYLSANLSGAVALSASALSTAIATYVFSADQILTGFVYDAPKYNFGDKITVKLMHPQAGLVYTLVDGWFVTGGPVTIDLYASRPMSGMYLQFEYQNAGIQSAEFICNLIKHKEAKLG